MLGSAQEELNASSAKWERPGRKRASVVKHLVKKMLGIPWEEKSASVRKQLVKKVLWSARWPYLDQRRLIQDLIQDLIRIRGGLIQNRAGMSETVRDILYPVLSRKVAQAFIHSSSALSGFIRSLSRFFFYSFCFKNP